MDVLEYGQGNDTHIVIVVSPLEYIRVQHVKNLNLFEFILLLRIFP